MLISKEKGDKKRIRRVRKTLNEVNKTINKHAFTLKINVLEEREKERLMKFIFTNEDKVWRDRGGRPGF